MRVRSMTDSSALSGIRVYGPDHWVDHPAYRAVIEDVTVPYKQGSHLFHSKRQENIFLHGAASSDAYVAFARYVPDGTRSLLANNAPVEHLFSPDECDAALLSMAANINPATGSDSMVQFFAELREGLPWIRSIGNGFLDTFGQTYLSYDFAWKMFTQDVIKLFLTSYAVDEFHRNWEEKRSRKFAGGRTLGRRLSRGVMESRPLQSNGAWVYAHSPEWIIRQKAKIFVRYSPGGNMNTIWGKFPYPPVDPSKLAQGLHGDWKTAWNALPWSWLIDWVVPLGEYLDATSESAGYHISEYWYGLNTTEEIKFPSLEKPSWLSVLNSNGVSFPNELSLIEPSKPGITRYSYQRIPREPAVIPHGIVTSANKVGTLTALASKFLGQRLRI